MARHQACDQICAADYTTLVHISNWRVSASHQMMDLSNRRLRSRLGRDRPAPAGPARGRVIWSRSEHIQGSSQRYKFSHWAKHHKNTWARYQLWDDGLQQVSIQHCSTAPRENFFWSNWFCRQGCREFQRPLGVVQPVCGLGPSGQSGHGRQKRRGARAPQSRLVLPRRPPGDQKMATQDHRHTSIHYRAQSNQ